MKKYIIIGLLICALVVGCTETVKTEINSFEECIAAGNPVIEGNQRQCKDGDNIFIEDIDETPSEITIEQAGSIAQDSECTEKGTLTDIYMYNEVTKTWWIDLTMKPEFENELCFPACVISEETKTAEINYRCTGALLPE